MFFNCGSFFRRGDCGGFCSGGFSAFRSLFFRRQDFGQHFYRFGLGTCPWCERMAMLGGWDPFPSRKAVKRGEHLQPVITRSIGTLVIDPYGNNPPTMEPPQQKQPEPTPQGS